MTIPRVDPALTGTVDQAGAFLQAEWQQLGIERPIAQDEFAWVEQFLIRPKFPEYDGHTATGAMVNTVLDLMEPYAASLLAERPFPDAPQNQTGRPFGYDAVLPWTLPTNDRDVLRADLWGCRVPGAPVIRRGSSRYPESVLTYLLHDYDAHWRAETYAAHHRRGHTHFYLSWPDARDAAGLSIAQFVELCREVQRAGFWVGVLLLAKGRQFGNDIDGDPFRMSFAQSSDRVHPILDALLSAGVVAEAVPAWEMDLFCADGGPTIDLCRWVGQQAHAGGASCWLHFSTHVTSWYQDGDPRGRYGFWDDLGDTVNGLHYQAGSDWDPAELQGRMMDTLRQFEHQGNRHKLRAFESKASAQFDQESVWAEQIGRQTGFLACCTGGPKSGGTSAHVWGSANGNRNPYTGEAP